MISYKRQWKEMQLLQASEICHVSSKLWKFPYPLLVCMCGCMYQGAEGLGSSPCICSLFCTEQPISWYGHSFSRTPEITPFFTFKAISHNLSKGDFSKNSQVKAYSRKNVLRWGHRSSEALRAFACCVVSKYVSGKARIWTPNFRVQKLCGFYFAHCIS